MLERNWGIGMTIGDSLGPEGKRPELNGIGGWLAFLCVSLLILTPLRFLMEIVPALLSVDQASANAEMVGGIVAGAVFTGFAVYTGIGLLLIWRNALRTAKWYFFIVTGFGALGAASFVLEPQPMTPSEIMSLASGFAVSIAWLAYLYRSERVRNTYGKNTIRDAAEVFR